jgi:plasmid stabilization system protein ParE
MPRGDKSAYTSKQKRKAEHIEEGYRERGVSKKEAESRAWATVNAEDHGGKKSGSGRGKKSSKAPARRGGKVAAARKTARKQPAAKADARQPGSADHNILSCPRAFPSISGPTLGELAGHLGLSYNRELAS